MKLSELKTGESAVIVKVSGHGGFRKRVIEMGFIKGKKVDVLLNAPLQDPVKYKIMGYEVSLRHSEADHIEVVSIDEAKNDAKLSKAEEEDRQQVIDSKIVDSNDSDEQALGDKMLVAERKDNASNEALAEQEAERLHRVINVALVGNPNCGKTSLFNFASGAHERVGNYSGVTVDAKVGEADFNGYHFNLVDLPGTYSLSAYSPEELYVRKQLIEHTPDIVINVIDTSNLERNLYLTTQLIDMHIRMVCALNMFDETEKRGDNIDYDKLGELFGISMIPTVFTNGRGVDKLFETIIELYEGKEDSSAHYRHIHINHGHEIEHGIEHIQKYLKADDSIRQRYSTRYLSIKLLENDKHAEEYVSHLKSAKEIFAARDEAAKRVKEETLEDSETAIMDAKYGFIHGALQEAGYEPGKAKDTYQVTHLIDSILTNKYVGFPIFVLLLFIMFSATFVLGEIPKGWIEDGVAWLGEFISNTMPDGSFAELPQTVQDYIRELERLIGCPITMRALDRRATRSSSWPDGRIIKTAAFAAVFFILPFFARFLLHRQHIRAVPLRRREAAPTLPPALPPVLPHHTVRAADRTPGLVIQGQGDPHARALPWGKIIPLAGAARKKRKNRQQQRRQYPLYRPAAWRAPPFAVHPRPSFLSV